MKISNLLGKKSGASCGASAQIPTKLEEVPNIGKSIAADLRSVGVSSPQQLAKQDPLTLYLALADRMGRRHDPCVLYTLMAAVHFLQRGEVLRWWEFTEAGKRLLASLAQSDVDEQKPV